MVVVEMVVLMSLTVNMLGDSRRNIIDANNVAFLVCVCWCGCG
jgi:hypothetical protein